MNRISVPEPKSVGLILSYKCNARCAHCMYACSPEWESNLISTSQLERTLSALSEYIIPAPAGPESIGLNHGLHLTGGEPFLHFEKLLQATRLADEKDIPSIFVETNSFWAKEEGETGRKLKRLRQAGLDGIMISVNPFYLEYIPFENTKRAVRLGREVFGGNAIVYQKEYLREFERMGIQGTLDLEEYLEDRRNNLSQRAEFFLSGRAPYEVPQYDVSGLHTRPAESWFDQPCRPPFLREWHNHVDNYGNYVPGYCGGLSLGDITDLDRLIKRGLDPEEYPILSYIAEGNFAGFYDLTRDYGYQEPVSGYYSKCHLCLDMRSFLNSKNNFEGLKPEEFYRNLPVNY